MTINLISDIHAYKSAYSETHPIAIDTGFDFAKLKPADVLVIAGDLTYVGDDYQDVYDYIVNHEAVKANFKEVIVVKGNHDFVMRDIFGNMMESICAKMDDDSKELFNINDNYDPFNDKWNFTKVVGNTMFICTPMFSPVQMNENADMNELAYRYGGYIDFRYIPTWSIEKNNEVFEKNAKFIYDMYEANKDKYESFVIVTHNCPTKKLIPAQFKNSKINDVFTVSAKHPLLDKIKRAKKVKYWLHGHTHSACNRLINGIRYVRNPIGYSYSATKNECNFKYDNIIEI